MHGDRAFVAIYSSASSHGTMEPFEGLRHVVGIYRAGGRERSQRVEIGGRHVCVGLTLLLFFFCCKDLGCTWKFNNALLLLRC